MIYLHEAIEELERLDLIALLDFSPTNQSLDPGSRSLVNSFLWQPEGWMSDLFCRMFEVSLATHSRCCASLAHRLYLECLNLLCVYL